jgi:hypothetical protein
MWKCLRNLDYLKKTDLSRINYKYIRANASVLIKSERTATKNTESTIIQSKCNIASMNLTTISGTNFNAFNMHIWRHRTLILPWYAGTNASRAHGMPSGNRNACRTECRLRLHVPIMDLKWTDFVKILTLTAALELKCHLSPLHFPPCVANSKKTVQVHMILNTARIMLWLLCFVLTKQYGKGNKTNRIRIK